MANAPDGRAQYFFVVGELLQKTDMTTGRRDRDQIVLPHLIVDEIKKGLTCATNAVERKMTVIYEKDDRAPPN